MSSSTPAARPSSELAPERARRRARLALLGLFAVFFVPILLAYALNVLFPDWTPFGRSNRGMLVEPARAVAPDGLRSLDGQPLSDGPFTELWTVIAVEAADDRPCADPCENAMVRMRQTRLALGKDAERLQRWLVIPGPTHPPVKAVIDRYPGMRVLGSTPAWAAALEGAAAVSGTLYLVDPQGYLVLRYGPDLADDALLKDLKRLLRISKIG